MKSEKYRPIDCGFYDYFEAAIVQKRPVALVYRDADGNQRQETLRLRDLRTENQEEFVQLPDESWLRLDAVISLDGRGPGPSCDLPN